MVNDDHFTYDLLNEFRDRLENNFNMYSKKFSVRHLICVNVCNIQYQGKKMTKGTSHKKKFRMYHSIWIYTCMYHSRSISMYASFKMYTSICICHLN